MSKSKGGSPRKFSEKIALLNRKEAEGNAEFERILKEVEETTRAPAPAQSPSQVLYHPQSQASSGSSSWIDGPAACSYNNTFTPEGQLEENQNCQFICQQQQYYSQSTTATGNQSLRAIHGQVPMNQLLHPQQQPQQHHHHHHQQQHQSIHHHHHHHLQQSPSSSLVGPTNVVSNPNNSTTPAIAIQDNNHQISVETPAGVPNINIFPIVDDNNYPQQQVPSPATSPATNNISNSTMIESYRNDCSNLISSARSLPDIANLRVSGGSPVLTPSFSDHKIGALDYDCNSDNHHQTGPIMTNNSPSAGQQSYCTNHHHNHNHQQQAQASPWQVTSANSFNNQQNSLSRQQQSVQDYCQPFQPGTIVRANSTNAVLCSWTSGGAGSPITGAAAVDNNNTLATDNSPLLSGATPRISNNLSKSSEVYYGYIDDSNSSTTNCYATPTLTTNNSQQNATNQLMVRSNSYNNIESIDFQGDNASNICTPQQMFVEDVPQYQFYE